MEIHKEIKEFGDIIIKNGKKIDLELQNEIYHFITEPRLFGEDNPNLKSDCKRFEIELSVDSESVKNIFNSNHIDGEGPNLITDKSGRIFKYYFGFGKPTLKILFNSIWDIFENKEYFEQKLISTQGIVYFKKVEFLKDYIDLNEVNKFDIHGFYIEDYKKQLEKLFEQSKGLLKLNSFTWKGFEWDKTEEIDCTLDINNFIKNIKIEKSKWYYFKFPTIINMILEEIKSSYRISLVHENSWDEIHGIKLSDINEFRLLKQKNLIIE